MLMVLMVKQDLLNIKNASVDSAVRFVKHAPLELTNWISGTGYASLALTSQKMHFTLKQVRALTNALTNVLQD